jgi:predicted HicB family RNase H-like nuclease
MKKYINFKINPELHVAIKIFAARKNITVCKLMENLIIAELERNKVLEEEWITNKKICDTNI